MILDIFGASVIAWSVFVSEREERARGLDTGQVVLDRIRQSTYAKIGLVILIVGFILQIIGSWPR